ncbi:MAG: hypothetical protein ACHQ2E_11405 [Gemmatimonadales bacterium]
MRARAQSGRTLTILAAGFLALDGLLLGLSGWWVRSLPRMGAGMALLGAAGVVMHFWKKQRARLEEIADARAALKAEASHLRELLRQRRTS